MVMTLNIPDNGSKRVVVVGGGFAGLQLVKKLSKSDYQVVLIDRNNFHMFQPLLYQVATAELSPGDIAFPFRKLFRGKRGVFYRMAEVRRVDVNRNTVHTDRGSLRYDFLVLATGSTTNFFGMQNIERAAYAMKEVSEAVAIRNRVLLHIEKAVELPDNPIRSALLNIVIVGGGATGVELAGAFAEMKRSVMPRDYPEYHQKDINIYLIEGSGRLLGTMSEKTSQKTLQILTDRGVKVHLNSTVVDYRNNKVILKDGGEIPTDNLIWTSGVTVKLPDGLERFEKGRGERLLTDMYFRVKGADNIFAVGDASIQTDDPANPNGYPQLARVAIEQAGHLARNLTRLAKGKLPEKFDYTQYPVLATVGRNKTFLEYKDFRMGGFFAWVAWAGVHLFLILGVKNKVSIFGGWFWNYVTYDLPNRVIIMLEAPIGQPPRKKSPASRPGGNNRKSNADAAGDKPAQKRSSPQRNNTKDRTSGTGKQTRTKPSESPAKRTPARKEKVMA